MTELNEHFKRARNDKVNLEGILRSVGQPLLHYARVLGGSLSNAEDVLQDVMLTLLQQGSNLRAIRDPRAWLFKVVRNRALALRQDSEKEIAAPLCQAVEGDPSARLVLEETLRQFSAREQEILLLHLWEDLTFSEIAEVLGIPRGTALSCYHRALARMNKEFDTTTQDKTIGISNHA